MNINKYLTLFNNDNEYEDFYGDKSKGYNYPNTSYALEEKNVHYEPIDKASSIVLNKYSFTFKKGDTEQLTATVLPSTSTIGNVVWKSSNCRVATVDQNGLVTAVALTGSCDIYAMTFDGSNLTATCHCELEYYPVTSVTLNYNVMTIDVEGTGQLIATVEPSKACQDVVWGSSDPSIISVDSNGLVKAEAISGDAVVTVTTVDQGLTASCAVHIDFHPVTGVTLNTDYLEFLPDGESTQTLVATVLPTDATIQDVTWSSSDETIATVDENGVVTATALGENTGTCIITVTTVDNAYTAECEVKVKPDYDTRYFTLRQLTGGPAIVHWSRTSSPLPNAYISFDNGDSWESMEDHHYGIDTTGAGQTILFKRVYTSPGSPESGENTGTIASNTTGTTWAVEGNIMSLVYGDDFVGKEDFGDITDTGLFEALLTNVNGSDNSRNIVSVDDLRLPAKVLTERCYARMFSNQVFRVPPKLPAMTLAKECYSSMFYRCENMTSMPELPATDIPYGAYQSMFYRCDGLTKIPSFKNVTTFNTYSFRSTFGLCKNLTTLPDKLFTNSVQIPESACITMFSGCTSLTAVPENFLENVTSASGHSFDGMFMGCTSLVTPPKLPVKPTSYAVYANMFSGCTSLTTLPRIQSDSTYNVAASGFSGMLADCTSLTEIPEGYLSNVTGVSNYAFGSMFSGCTSLTAVPENLLPIKDKLAYGCYRYMFAGCTNITSGPALPTYDLSINNASYCYEGMYSGCTNLNEITCMAVNGLNTGKTRNWAVGVAPTGTFYKHKDATAWVVDSVSSIPPGWTAVDIDISLNKESTALNVDETEQLHAVITPVGRSQDVVWETSDENVVTVDSNGRITAVGDGKSIIKCTSTLYGISATCDVYTNINSVGFTLKSKGSSEIKAKIEEGYTVSASTDNGANWVELPNSTTTSYTLNSGGTVMFKASLTGSSASAAVCKFSGSTGDFVAEGNPMSLIYGNDFSAQTSMGSGSLNGLFSDASGLTSTSLMVLPATSLSNNCYNSMFKNCVNLRNTPKLPATTLAEGCYANMFEGCSSLTEVPNLSATSLARSCYENMFGRCIGLVTVPSDLLPATILASSSYSNCYKNMFQSCTSLTTVPNLPSATLSYSCYASMFRDCTSLVRVPENLLPSMALTGSCYQAMFSGCTSLLEGPKLPANELYDACYQMMFQGCTALTATTESITSPNISAYACQYMYANCKSLVTAPYIAANGSVGSNGCYGMFRGCTSLVNTQERLDATTLWTGSYYSMYNGCTSLVEQPEVMATTIGDSSGNGGSLAYMFEGCTSLVAAKPLHLTNYGNGGDTSSSSNGTCGGMYSGCASLATVPRNMIPNVRLKTNTFSSMFSNCTSLVASPILPAADTSSWAYRGMFSGCRNLKEITCLLDSDQPNGSITDEWWYLVPTGGTLYKKAGRTWTTMVTDQYHKYAGLPSGWTQVDYVEPTNVSISDTSVILSVGNTHQLTATVQPNDATDTGAIWTSSDASVATVDANGLVTAVGSSGTAVITATTYFGGYTATCDVTIG